MQACAAPRGAHGARTRFARRRRRARRRRARAPQLPQHDDFFVVSLTGSVTTILVPSPGRGALSSAASAFLLTMW